ncbi:MAG TPA: glycosyltransferase family 2 protein, partial [Dissulfurispiraceae bacterium]
MIILQIVLAALLAFLSLAILYLFFLAAVYFFRKPAEKGEACAPKLRFAVIIPAHNESEGIAGTLTSLKALDYPGRLYEAVVVADNCTDNTAETVRAEGFRCVERNDPSRRGKGHALEYAIRRLMREEFDAFAVVDADSTVSGNFLRVMNAGLLSGHKAVQAYYGMSNPDASPLTYLFCIGNIIENKLFYAAKSKLGLPVNLRGNGMCFSRELLIENPWDAYSIVEDVEYGLKLIRRGIRILFEEEAQVLARQPETVRQAGNQRIRWASGNVGASKAHAVKLMFAGLAKKDPAFFDAGFSLLVLSKPLLLFLSLLAATGAILFAVSGGAHGGFYAAWALSLLLAQLV